MIINWTEQHLLNVFAGLSRSKQMGYYQYRLNLLPYLIWCKQNIPMADLNEIEGEYFEYLVRLMFGSEGLGDPPHHFYPRIPGFWRWLIRQKAQDLNTWSRAIHGGTGIPFTNDMSPFRKIITYITMRGYYSKKIVDKYKYQKKTAALFRDGRKVLKSFTPDMAAYVDDGLQQLKAAYQVYDALYEYMPVKYDTKSRRVEIPTEYQVHKFAQTIKKLGFEPEVPVLGMEICIHCAGTGASKGNVSSNRICSRCNGYGYLMSEIRPHHRGGLGAAEYLPSRMMYPASRSNTAGAQANIARSLIPREHIEFVPQENEPMGDQWKKYTQHPDAPPMSYGRSRSYYQPKLGSFGRVTSSNYIIGNGVKRINYLQDMLATIKGKLNYK